MGLNITVLLTFILLALMCGAGAMSGSWGYKLGKEALKGITQPDSSPTNSLTGTKGSSTRGEKMAFLREQDIIKKVKSRTSGRLRETEEKALDKKNSQKKNSVKPKKKLPIKSTDQGITMAVYSIRQRGNSLLLDMFLENKTDRSVKFLYSFLNVTDDKKRILSASVEDLPSELAPSSEPYYGTVIIPTALLDKAETLTMTLTDYPGQKLNLKITELPIND